MSTVRAFFFESIGINSFWFSANIKWNIFIWNIFHCNVVLLHITCFCIEMKFHRDICKNRNLRTNFSAYYCQYPERHIQPRFEYNYHNGIWSVRGDTANIYVFIFCDAFKIKIKSNTLARLLLSYAVFIKKNINLQIL